MKKYIPHTLIVVMAVLLCYSIERCSYNSGKFRLNTAALADTVSYFTNAMGTKTATVNTLSAHNAQLRALILEKDAHLAETVSGFTKVHTLVKYNQVFRVDTVYVAFETNSDTLPAFERSGAVFDKWYSFDYRLDNEGLALANLSMQTETAVVTGIKRKWFLGEETLVTDVSNTNPYVTVTQLKAAEVILPVPWYKKWYVWAAAGLAGGFLLSK